MKLTGVTSALWPVKNFDRFALKVKIVKNMKCDT